MPNRRTILVALSALAAAVALGAQLGCARRDGIDGRLRLLTEGIELGMDSIVHDGLGLVGGGTGTLEVVGLEAVLSIELGPDDWRPTGVPGVFEHPNGRLPSAPDRTADPALLELPDGRRLAASLTIAEDIPPDTFLLGEPNSLLSLPSGEQPPERSKLFAPVARARVEGGSMRFDGQRLSAHGFPVWPGDRAFLDDVESGVLRFTLVVEPFEWLDGPEEGLLELEVLVDGEQRWRSGAIASDEFSSREVSIALEHEGECSIEFAVEGQLARVGVIAPRVDSRRELRDLPGTDDLILVQADTLRADGLGAYGSPHGLTPFLDALADRAVLYERARSTATSTLPAHATLFSGRYPLRAGIAGSGTVLPAAIETLPERLRELGFRTGAVTDGVMVSARYGFDQGFEWYSEHPDGDLESTVARVAEFLAGYDGRPTFLFVQTYAAHTPYHTSGWARERFGEALGLEGDADELFRELRALDGVKPIDDAVRGRRRDLLRRLEAHYRVGLADLDRGLERLFDRIGRSSIPFVLGERGTLVFTSDHGETFTEHPFPFHYGPPFEEQLRIPLMVVDPRLDPGRVPAPVSWIDLPPTLLSLAGAEAPSDWPGRSLVTPVDVLDPWSDERTLFAFEAKPVSAPGAAAIVRGRSKLMLFETADGAAGTGPRAAYDLGVDPGETDDVWGRADWPEQLLEHARADFLESLEPVVPREFPGLDAAGLEQLRRLGYVLEDG